MVLITPAYNYKCKAVIISLKHDHILKYRSVFSDIHVLSTLVKVLSSMCTLLPWALEIYLVEVAVPLWIKMFCFWNTTASYPSLRNGNRIHK